jgi:anaerobic C4-dicarboxylate transporter
VTYSGVRCTGSMRVVIAAGLGILTAAAVWLAIGFFIVYTGGTECDRSTCNWLGELVSNHSGLVAGVVLVIAVTAGVSVARRALARHLARPGLKR